MQKQKPQRMCCVCRTRKEKAELVRVVRTADGNVVLDDTLKMPGRGAYICKDAACIENAQKRRALERSLSAEIAPEVYSKLCEGTVNG